MDYPTELTIAPTKGLRPSLGELLQWGKVGEENNSHSSTEKCLTNFKTARKFRKWRSLKSCAVCTPTANSVSAGIKLHKLVKIFSRRVHPERSLKSHENENKNTGGAHGYDSNYYCSNNAGRTSQRNETMAKDGILCCNSDSTSSPFEINGCVSLRKREYWDKTDPEYLVLEFCTMN